MGRVKEDEGLRAKLHAETIADIEVERSRLKDRVAELEDALRRVAYGAWPADMDHARAVLNKETQQ